MENPDMDYWIIAARKAVLDAKETLALKKGPDEALDVQAAQQSWNAMRKLTLVKKDENQ
jgi:hypothetical protein